MNNSPENSPGPEQTPKRTNEQMLDQLADLPDRAFVVEREGGNRETGWSIVGAMADTEGVLRVTLMNQDTRDMKRGINAETFLAWQNSEPFDAGAAERERLAWRVGGEAPTERALGRDEALSRDNKEAIDDALQARAKLHERLGGIASDDLQHDDN